MNGDFTLRLQVLAILFVMHGHCAYSFQGDVSKRIDSLQADLRRTNVDSTKFEILLALYSAQVGTPTQAMTTLTQALEVSKLMKDKRKEGQVYSRFAYLYNKIGEPVKATERLLDALSIFEKLGDSVSIAAINNNIGMVYADRTEYEEALNRFERALAIWRASHFKSGIARALFNIAEVYLSQNKHEHALQLYVQAQALCEETGEKQFLSSILKGTGRAYAKAKVFDKALTFFERAYLLAVEYNLKATQAEILVEQSKINRELGRASIALGLSREALAISKASNYKLGVMNSYNELSQSYNMLKDYKLACDFQMNYVALKDSIRDSENISKIQRLNSAHELDKKEDEIALINQKYEADLFRRNAFAITGLLLLTSIILFLGYQRTRGKRKLEIQNHELELKSRQLEFLKQGLMEKSDLLEKVTIELDQLNSDKNPGSVQAEKYNKILESHILTPEDWENFKKAFEDVYPNFFGALRFKYPEITGAELRLCALIKMNLSVKEAAKMLGVSPESVKQSRYRLKKKLNIGESAQLEDFVNQIHRR